MQTSIRRLLALILILACAVGISACALPDPGEANGAPTSDAQKDYPLTITGETSRVTTRFADRYPAGEKLTLRSYLPPDGHLRAELNGEELSAAQEQSSIAFSFTMPAAAAEIRLFLSDEPGPRLPDGDPGNTGENGGTQTTDGPVALTFVSINDLHGSIEQDESGRNGISNTKIAIDRLSAFYGDRDAATDVRDDLVLFANGDMFQGQAVSNMSRGRAVLEAMNAMGFDGMTLGNHEFDWGLPTILPYWDGDAGNGEANFPLVSANVRQISTGKMIYDLSERDRIVSCAMTEKMGVKIGMIGLIGPCENSILAAMVADYRFEEVVAAVGTAAQSLKDDGAQLVMVSVHYGNTADPEDLEMNRGIASLKDERGDYLVDVLFNGHSHVRQAGAISRSGGAPLPIVQAGSNNQYVGYIRLTYDATTDAVSLGDYGQSPVRSVGTEYDRDVELVVSEYVRTQIAHLPTLATSKVTVSSKYDYADYAADLMLKAFGADYSCGNYGGLRGTGGIVSGGKITEANLYEVIPFDNTVCLVTLPGKVLARIAEENSENWYFGEADGSPALSSLKNSEKLYTLAVIDYVYTGTYFSPYRSLVTSERATGHILREILIADVKAHGDRGLLWSFADGAILDEVEY